MKTVLRFVASAGLLAACALSVNAHAAADSVLINTVGTGVSAALTTSPSVLTYGSGYIETAPSGAGSTFVEHGAYRLIGADGVSPFGAQDITAVYSLFGRANDATSPVGVSGGQIDLYADANFDFGTAGLDPSVVFGANNGRLIASFNVASGVFYPTSATSFAGSVSAQAIAGSMASGYFFSANQDDLAFSNALMLTLNVASSINFAPTAAELTDIVCKQSGTCVAPAAGAFTVRDQGTVILTAVPEPASYAMLLAGLGLLGMAARRRTR